ncbi:MAG: hypothetical protein PHS19_02155 [Eubacteriales bacterium]|nr:hypothetical protein [Eubacteriales bacterium]
MKLLAKPVDAMVVFRTAGEYPIPYKFKVEENGEQITVFVHQIIKATKTKVCGAENIVYECQSTINGHEKRFELKYFCSRCQWQLYKI